MFTKAFRSSLLWCWAVLLVGGSVSTAQEPKTKPLSVTIAGQIIEADAKDVVRQMPCKIHVLKLEKGKSYLIDLTSTEFDSYLRLEDSTGLKIAHDDDGGGGLNARLRFTPTKDDLYKIIATSFSGGEGNYTLTVKDVNAPIAANPPVKPVIPPKKIAVEKKPRPVPPANDAIKLDAPTEQTPVTVQGQLQDGDPVDPVQNRIAKNYAVELDASMPYSIALSSGDFDAFLRIVDANGKELARDDDSGGNLDARVLFVPPAKGTYRIVATTFQGGTGAFRLDIRPTTEFGAPVKNDPQLVHNAAKAFFIPGQLTNQDPKDAVQTQSPCQVHQVKLEKDKTYVIDLIGSQMDAYLRIEDAQKANLAEDDDGGDGLNSRLEFTPGETAIFRLIATNLDGKSGSYILAVREKK